MKLACTLVGTCLVLATTAGAQSVSVPNLLDLRIGNPPQSGTEAGDLAGPAGQPIPPGEFLLRGYLERSHQPLSESFLTTYPEVVYGIKRYELSRFGCAMRAAEMGSTLGMFVGALGNTLGLIDEDTAWILAGSAAAAAALWGGTALAEDPEFRIRFRWEE